MARKSNGRLAGRKLEKRRKNFRWSDKSWKVRALGHVEKYTPLATD